MSAGTSCVLLSDQPPDASSSTSCHLANTDQLTWHTTPCGTSLPKDEIWLKVGGDKGGGSFKFCLQVVNRKSPNSADHTVVLALLEADDSLQNMHICIDPFADELEELQGMKWR